MCTGAVVDVVSRRSEGRVGLRVCSLAGWLLAQDRGTQGSCAAEYFTRNHNCRARAMNDTTIGINGIK